jgi:LuxR family maltose regulon positive regulatory protein
MTIPQLPPRHISRRRLVKAVSAAVERPLTLVAAGPGAGKTVLLSDWAQRREMRPAWVSLDSQYDDPDRFMAAVRIALRVAGVRRDGPAEAAFDHARSDTVSGRLLAPILDAVDPSSPVVLILDDAHVLTNSDVLDALDSWLRRWPGQLRMVLAARSDPLLPLHRYRLAGIMSELRAADLAMTEPEAAQLLATHSVHLSSGDLEMLTRRTEGWIAGVRLSAMRMEGSPRSTDFVTEFAIDEASIGEYLMDEVLSRQPPDALRVLVETSFLAEVNGEIAAAITGLADAGAMLAELSRSNSFVSPTDASASTFRYHQLLAEILRYLLRREPAQHRVDLMRRAARWYFADGDIGNAVHFAAQASDWRLVAQMIVDGGLLHALTQRTRIDALDPEAFVAAAADGADADQTELLIAAAVMFIRHGRLNQARKQVEQITSRPSDHNTAMQTDLLGLILARAQHRVADVDEFARRILAACERFPQPGLAAAVRLEQAMTHFYAGSHAAVEGLLQRAQDEAATAGLRALELDCAAQLAHVNAFWARLRTSRANSQRANLLLRDDPRLTAPPTLLLAAGLRDVVAGEFVDALRDLSRAKRMIRGHRDLDLRTEIEVLQTIVYLGTGRPDAALRSLSPVESSASGLTRDYRVAAEAVVNIQAGRASVALRLLDAHRDNPPASITCLARGMAELARGDLDAAQAAIRPILTASGVPSIRTVLVAALVLEARIAAKRARGDARAAESLVRAVELSDGDMVLPFLGSLDDLGELIVRHPLLAAEWPLPTEDYVGAASDPATRTASIVMDPLTEKEQAVLRWLATSMSTRDIAETLGLSVNTVKTHIAAIYRKLNAPRRREAVLRARQLELL